MGESQQTDEWYYLENEKPVGPFTAEALLQLRSANVIADDTLVSRAGTDSWGKLALAEFQGSSASAPPAPSQAPPSATGTKGSYKRELRHAGALILGLAILALVFVLFIRPALRGDSETTDSHNRPEYEQNYLDHLSTTRASVVRSLECWEDVQLLNEFPNGPHFRNMQASRALAETERLTRNLENLGPTMRELANQLNDLADAGTVLIQERPDLEEKHKAIGIPGGLSFSMGDPFAEIALTRLRVAIDEMLAEFDASPAE